LGFGSLGDVLAGSMDFLPAKGDPAGIIRTYALIKMAYPDLQFPISTSVGVMRCFVAYLSL